MRQERVDIPNGWELRSFDREADEAPFMVEQHTTIDGIESHTVAVRAAGKSWTASRAVPR